MQSCPTCRGNGSISVGEFRSESEPRLYTKILRPLQEAGQSRGVALKSTCICRLATSQPITEECGSAILNTGRMSASLLP